MVLIARRFAVVDAAVALWLVGCFTLGALVREEIRGLTGLVTSVELVAGQAEGIAESVAPPNPQSRGLG